MKMTAHKEHTSLGASRANRASNLELFRVLTMLMIIAHHYVVNSGVDQLIFLYSDSIRAKALLLFGAWGKTGINCFLMISGYFMCKSSLTVRKYMKWLLEVLFYNLVCYFTFVEGGYVALSLQSFWKAIWPLGGVADGFISCYLIFALFIPYLNLLIRSMEKRQHLCLMILCLLIYTGLGTLRNISVVMNYVTWFMVVYLIAAYIRCYPQRIFKRAALWGVLCALFILLSVASILLGMKKGLLIEAYYYLHDANKILAVAVAVSAFLFFKNVSIDYNRWINWLGASTFGVLLIHANSDAMRTWLWQDTLKVAEMFMTPWLPLHAILSVIGIFLVCTLCDRIRIVCLEQVVFYAWDKLSVRWFGKKKYFTKK